MATSKELPADFMFSQIIDRKHEKKTAREVLRDALNDDATFGEMKPFIANGIVTGHRALDWDRALSVILSKEDFAKRLAPLNMRPWALCLQLKSAVREKLHLNKQGKVDGVAKRIIMQEQESSE